MQNRPSPRAALAAIGAKPTAGSQLILATGKEKDDSSGSSEELNRFKRRTAANSKLASSAAGRAPEFVAPIGNVSAVLGRDVRLVCTVENLGQHQVSFVREISRIRRSKGPKLVDFKLIEDSQPDNRAHSHLSVVSSSSVLLLQCEMFAPAICLCGA